MSKHEAVFTKDLQNKKITFVRLFEADLPAVWDAWTKSELLDLWWAPKPYRAETKIMDFREGGFWLYQMVGPEGDGSWCKENFKAIEVHQSIANSVSFCDEHGQETPDFPTMQWKKEFNRSGDDCVVTIEITFDKIEDMETIVGMGMQEGFTAGLNNLDQYLSTRFMLRKELKPDNKVRVTSYLNFPGKTEEAFNFYKTVFNGEFTGVGLRRFGDIQLPAEAPPLSEADKKLIIHAELTIMGGYVLMATDAPESMGFTMRHGNNMHISVEPASREETERIFGELSAGGTVTMPLADMFFGAYFAEFTDRYGINWMLNYQPNE